MIEPCPFCGASGEDDKIEAHLDEHYRTRMRCSVCKAEGPAGNTMMTYEITPATFKRALNNWNQRHDPTITSQSLRSDSPPHPPEPSRGHDG